MNFCRNRSAGKAKSSCFLLEAMPEPLRDSFLADLRCSPDEASALADLARTWHSERRSEAEDTDEDLIVRLRDPRAYGDFVAGTLADGRLSVKTRTALVEGAFDLLSLPGSEGDVFLVEARAPKGLLTLAAFLAAHGGLTVLHAMHLLYAVFLDRHLVVAVPREARTAVLDAVVRLPEANERVKILYACLHLAVVPAPEAYRALKALLRAAGVPDSFKRALASSVAAEDHGAGRLAALARDEGLLPPEAADAGDPSVIANVPRMPDELASLGRRWLRLHSAR